MLRVSVHKFLGKIWGKPIVIFPKKYTQWRIDTDAKPFNNKHYKRVQLFATKAIGMFESLIAHKSV